MILNTHRVSCVTLTTQPSRAATAPAISNLSAAIRPSIKTPKLSTIASYWIELTTLSCLSLPAVIFSFSSHHSSTTKSMATTHRPKNRSKTHRQRSQWAILSLTRSRRLLTLPQANRHLTPQRVVQTIITIQRRCLLRAWRLRVNLFNWDAILDDLTPLNCSMGQTFKLKGAARKQESPMELSWKVTAAATVF